MSMLDAFSVINSLALPITLFAGVTYLAFSLAIPIGLAGVTYLALRLWRKKQFGKALKALLIVVTVLIGLSILLLLDILIGHLFPIR
jgi:uncharacterized membrane protein HdeD (DUF308 family)